MCRGGDRPTVEETCAEFEARIAAAIVSGESYYVCGSALDTDTLAAIRAVAQNPTEEAIALAHLEFSLQLDGTHRQWTKAAFNRYSEG
jgi:hypothetical protein